MTIPAVTLEPSREPAVAASDFARWLAGITRAIRDHGHSDVPCGDCTACCRGAYFITLRPEDEAARARIPEDLLFPAPGAPAGHFLLGYDERGRCPMLRRDACAIYQDRPGTCRTYDCRIFAATGIAEPGRAKAGIMARAARWRFSYACEADRAAHETLKRGARFLLEAPELEALLPGNATHLAMLAIQLQPVFAGLGDALRAARRSGSGRRAVQRLRDALQALAAGR